MSAPVSAAVASSPGCISDRHIEVQRFPESEPSKNHENHRFFMNFRVFIPTLRKGKPVFPGFISKTVYFRVFIPTLRKGKPVFSVIPCFL